MSEREGFEEMKNKHQASLESWVVAKGEGEKVQCSEVRQLDLEVSSATAKRVGGELPLPDEAPRREARAVGTLPYTSPSLNQ